MSGPVEVPFQEHGASQQSGHEDPEPRVIVDQAATASFPGANVPAGRLAIAVLRGQQMTGGYSIGVRRVVRNGATLEIHAALGAPPSDAMVIQVLTSPAQLISVDRADATGVDRVVLIDDSGAERASTAASIR